MNEFICARKKITKEEGKKEHIALKMKQNALVLNPDSESVKQLNGFSDLKML